MSLSSITLSGRLKTNPDKRQTPSNIPVTNLILEVTYVGRGTKAGEYKLSSQTVKVNAWRDLAEICSSFKAGDKVFVSGRAQINAYTTQDGKRRREIEIDATSVSRLEDILNIESVASQDDSEEAPPNSQTSSDKQANNFEKYNDIEALNTQEEIPF